MSNKFNRILSSILVPTMIFLSGCSNGTEVKEKGKIKSDTFSSELSPSIENSYNDVICFIPYDAIDFVERYYFTTINSCMEMPEDISMDQAIAVFGKDIPLDDLKKSKIENYIANFKSVVDEEVSVVIHILSVVNDEGYNCESYLVSIEDVKNDLMITQHSVKITLNDEILVDTNSYLTESGEEEVFSNDLSVSTKHFDVPLSYEDIVKMSEYFNNENKDENVLKKS